MNPILKILLFPISLVYGFFMFIRNLFFDYGIIREKKYPIPIINVGNLSVGGTGKTPHVEYLIRLLSKKYRIATLSRGYKRRTRGFVKANASHSFLDIGDEPLQYFQKFPDITVAVCESRRKGISNLLQEPIPPEVIILDDAYQHRFVHFSTNLLLTDYMNLYVNDYLFPCGKLREFRSGAKRADAVIVTKNEVVLSSLVMSMISNDLKLQKHQKLFFSYISYGNLIPLFETKNLNLSNIVYIQVVAGIANPYPLEAYLKNKCSEISLKIFPDHHNFTTSEIKDIVSEFKNHLSVKKIIVTTEKDAKRLQNEKFRGLFQGVPIFYIPIQMVFHHTNDRETFDEFMLKQVEEEIERHQ